MGKKINPIKKKTTKKKLIWPQLIWQSFVELVKSFTCSKMESQKKKKFPIQILEFLA